MYLNKGRVEFSCDNLLLERGFYWAKARALSYTHERDAVGDWYEASLPGRNAFCMRDVAHYALGAQILGLASHNKNMLLKFAQNISESRAFCSYWEISKDNKPLQNDYTSDTDFWYNLPANFDILQACWKMFRWTNDDDYLHLPELNRFYNATVSDYIRAWDKNGDGIPERVTPGSRLGIPSYEERDEYAHAAVMGDLIALQALAFDAYARIHRVKGNNYLFDEYTQKASSLREYYNRNWWNSEQQRFYSAMSEDGIFYQNSADGQDLDILPLYYGLITDKAKLKLQLDRMKSCDSAFVEYLSYLPELFFQYDLNEEAYNCLLALTDSKLKRREYPEISFSVVGAVTLGIMGVDPHADEDCIRTIARLPKAICTACMDNIPVFGGEICVEQTENRITRLINRTGGSILWQPIFPCNVMEIYVNGKPVPANSIKRDNGQVFSFAEVRIENGYQVKAEVYKSEE